MRWVVKNGDAYVAEPRFGAYPPTEMTALQRFAWRWTDENSARSFARKLTIEGAPAARIVRLVSQRQSKEGGTK